MKYLAAYRRILTEFEEEYDLELDPPDIEADTAEALVVADPETYTIRMGYIPYTRMDRKEFEDEVRDAIRDLYDAALETALEDHVEELERLYADFDPEVALEEQYFDDLRPDEDEDGYSTGKYHRHKQRIRIDDNKYMKHIDPKRQVVTDHSLDKLLRHECGHGLQYGSNPYVWALRDYIKETTEDSHTDVRRASIEAITRFEQHRLHKPSSMDKRFQKLHDPWQVPDVFTDHTDMDEYGTQLFDTPYKLGHFTAHAVDAAFQQVHGEDEGRNLTREFLLRCVTTPTGLVGSVEKSFELRDLPYYPEHVQQWEEWLSQREQPETHVEPMVDAAATLAADADTEQEELQYYYSVHALVHTAEKEGWVTDELRERFEQIR